MRGSRLPMLLLAAWLFLAWSPPVLACPSCQEAIPNASDSEVDDQVRLARAYNHSIYLMVGMPYLLLGAVGFLVYRGLKQRASLQQKVGDPAQPLPPGAGDATDRAGASPCPATKRDDVSS